MEVVYIEDDKNFYKNISKYKNREEIVCLKYQNQIIKDDKSIKEYTEEDLKMKIYTINAVNIKDIKQRYNYIYDVVCNYLDKEFNERNICNFKDNKCISVRNNSHCKESENGCCYGRKRGLCKNLKNGKCNIKSISCKLFTCRYLKKNKIKYKINDIPLLKFFVNNRQKFIINNSIFKDKPEIIDLLILNK